MAPYHVRRPRLVSLATESRVAVLEAPGGYVKTALAAEIADWSGAVLVRVVLPNDADDESLLVSTVRRALSDAGIVR